MTAKVVSVNVGTCAQFEVSDGGTVESGIRKVPQSTSVLAGPEGFAGDEVSPDPSHGGPSKALHVFAVESYRILEAKAGCELPVPSFGENLTVEGYDDAQARVGDVLRIGEALVQVSMPTERCAMPGRSAGVPQLLKWMIETLRTGFYLRVLEAGVIGPGDAITMDERGPERWTVEALTRLMYREIEDESLVLAAQRIEALAPQGKARLLVHHRRRTGRELDPAAVPSTGG